MLAAHRDQKGLMVRVNRASTMALLYYEEDGHYMHKVIIMINVIIYFSFLFFNFRYIIYILQRNLNNKYIISYLLSYHRDVFRPFFMRLSPNHTESHQIAPNLSIYMHLNLVFYA